MVVDGAMNGEMLLAYVEQCLIPTFRRGDIEVLIAQQQLNIAITDQLHAARRVLHEHAGAVRQRHREPRGGERLLEAIPGRADALVARLEHGCAAKPELELNPQ